jgi:starch-binding outer membrane protein SusE/F
MIKWQSPFSDFHFQILKFSNFNRMKSKIAYFALFAWLLTVVGCTDKDTLDNLTVTAVQTLNAPTDNQAVTLTTAGSLTFKWDAATAEDGGLVMYEVVFDKVGGDFSNPIYTITSDNVGSYNYATVAHAVLDKVAKKAGINSSETGSVIWTVIASKGINGVKASKYNTLTVTRLAGFSDDEIPSSLYITGEGSDGGATLANAIQKKQTATGVFEIYTKLTAGKTYWFTSSNSGTPTTYYISADGTTLKETGTSTVSTTAVYRIQLDFTTGAATLTQIQKLTFFWSDNWDAGSLADFTYQGNGVWKLSNQAIAFVDYTTWTEERYKFYFTLGDGTVEWWDSNTWDNSQPTSSTAASYYYLYNHYTSADAVDALTDDIVYGYSYKFAESFNNENVNITVSFAPTGTYTHKVELAQ